MIFLLYSLIQSPPYSVEHNLTQLFAQLDCLLMFKSCFSFFSQHNVHHLSSGVQQNTRHQATVPSYDNQKPEEILHVRGAGRLELQLVSRRVQTRLTSADKVPFSPLKKSNYPQSIFCCLAPSLLTLRCRCSTIKMFEDDSGHRIINRQLG